MGSAALAALLTLVAPPLTVAGGRLALSVDGATGAVVALRDTADGTSYLAGPPAPLFRIQYLEPGGAERWTDAGAARRVVAEPAGGGLELVFEGLPAALTATVTIAPAGDGTRLRIAIANDGDAAIETVTFPDLRFARPLGGEADDDRMFLPGGNGCLVRNEGLRPGFSTWRQYPGSASMQFVAWYDDDRGVSLRCQDANAGAKTIAGVAEAEQARFELWARLPRRPGEDFDGPWWYLSPCAGSWQAAAAEYRAWALGQPWAAPKTGDAVPPAWLRAMPVVLTLDFRPLGNGRWFVPLERAREFARLWRDALGAEAVLVETRNFEREGCYTSPDFFPLYPSDATVAATLAALRGDGVRAQAMVASLKWMIERAAYHTPHYNVTPYDGRELFERDGRAACALGRDGQPTVREPFFTWDGRHAFLCPASAYARRELPAAARRFAAAGFALYELDQCNGGSVEPCYSTAHGHPPGPGPWQHEALAARMAEVRAAGRGVTPDFALSLEDPSELLIPYLDTYVSRAGNIIEWPAVGVGSEVVPAFEFVYHNRLQPMVIDLQHTVRPDPELLVRSARGFLAGAGLQTQLMAWQVLADQGEENLFPSPDAMDRAQLALLRSLCAEQFGPGRRFLAEGAMLPALDLAVPEFAFERTEYTSEGERRLPLTCPAVLHQGWRLPGGEEAWFFVNVTTEPVSLARPGGGTLTVPALAVTRIDGPWR